MPRTSPRQPSKNPPRPTDAELAILRVLWRRGPSTVREVLDALNESRPKPFVYTTALRFLQIMHEKGLVSREEGEKGGKGGKGRGGKRGHVYSPAVPAERTQRQMVGDLLDRAFGGSVHDLVLHALGSGRVSSDELQEIRKLLDDPDP